MANLASSRAVTFLDVETTHLDPTRSALLAISIITDWEGGKQDVWTTKIKPRDVEIEFASSEALKICGYNPSGWHDAPTLEEVADEIIKRLMWGPIVGHNVQFDIDHIRSSLKRRGFRENSKNSEITPENKNFRIGYPLIDTCALSFIFLPTERQNLNALREYFDIDASRAHAADTDAEDCRHVFYSIVNNTIGKMERQ